MESTPIKLGIYRDPTNLQCQEGQMRRITKSCETVELSGKKICLLVVVISAKWSLGSNEKRKAMRVGLNRVAK